jgi:methionine-rich copper-binding protein CopC
MRLSRFAIATGVLIGLTLAVAPVRATARRHLALVRSEPGKDAIVETAPTVLRLFFSEAPELKATTIKVVAKAGGAAALGKVAAARGDTKVVEAAFQSPPGPGTWAVTWRTMSDDGHVVSGEFSFQVKADH